MRPLWRIYFEFPHLIHQLHRGRRLDLSFCFNALVGDPVVETVLHKPHLRPAEFYVGNPTLLYESANESFGTTQVICSGDDVQ